MSTLRLSKGCKVLKTGHKYNGREKKAALFLKCPAVFHLFGAGTGSTERYLVREPMV